MSSSENENFYIQCLKKYYTHVDSIDEERKKGKDGDAFKVYLNAWKEFNIIWGYYIYLDKESGKLEFFTDSSSSKGNSSKSVFSRFGYKDIPIRFYYDKTIKRIDASESIGHSLRFTKNNTLQYLNDFSNGLPTVYKTLCSINGNCKEDDLDHIPRDANYIFYKDQNFYFILAEEILFFIYLYQSFEEEGKRANFLDQSTVLGDGNLKPNLSLVLNFALKVNDLLPQEHRVNVENSKYEIDFVRLEVQDQKEAYSFIHKIISAYKCVNQIDSADKVQNLARFNIGASIEIIKLTGESFIAHDLFVFPMVHATQEETSYQYRDTQINNPLLFCAYIETYYAINGDPDNLYEDGESRKGFKVTEMMCDHISKSLVESLYYGKIINKYRAKELVKAQKAAIMGRNMSHNIGSHVLFYLKNSLNDWSKIIDEKVLHALINEDGSISISEINDKTQLPFIYGLGKFINYLQERQDFIATISTNYIPTYARVDFKEGVFDEINYDLKALRHKGDPELTKHNIILDNIARSEKFARKNIQIAFGNYIGLDEDSDLGWSIVDQEKSEKDDLKLRKLSIAIPGGTVGRQAFFSIIENIIRNSCKHGGFRSLFTLTLNYIDPLENLEDSLVQEYFANGSYRIEDYIIFTITDDVKCSIDVIKNLKNYLLDPLINPDTLLQSEKYKGLKEIKISASWLIGKEYNDLDVDNVNVDGVKVEDDKYLIRYSFLLRKPKDLIIYNIVGNEVTQSHNSIIDSRSDEIFDRAIIFGNDSHLKNSRIQSNRVYLLPNEDFDRLIDSNDSENVSLQIVAIEQNLKKLFPDSSIQIDVKLKEGQCELKLFEENSSNNIYLLAKGHLNSKDDLPEFKRIYKFFDSAVSFMQGQKIIDYAEVVTGHNATKGYYQMILDLGKADPKKQKLLLLKTIEAALTKVMIIDERLFEQGLTLSIAKTVEKVFSYFDAIIEARHKLFIEKKSPNNTDDKKVDQNSFIDGGDNNALKEIIDFSFDGKLVLSGKELENIEQEFDKKYITGRKDVELKFYIINLYNCLLQYRLFEESLLDFVSYFEDNYIYKDGYVEKIYPFPGQKILDSFNRLLDERNNFDILKGVYICDIDFVSNSIINTNLQVIGTIENHHRDYECKIEINDSFYSKFDILTIHQGLLDKHIQLDEKAKEYVLEIKSYKNDVLRYVHSGGGKPHTLPRNSGFLLLTQIEYAYRNCKTDLVNLFMNTKIKNSWLQK